jgi:Tol biopolymer transport system component
MFILIYPVNSQIRVTKTEKIQIEPTKQWSNPQFSPDGKSIFFTTPSYDGIWEYSLENKSFKIITEDEGAGFGFNISNDLKEIIYRKNNYDNISHERLQEIIKMNLTNNSVEIIDKGANLSTPIAANGRVIYSKNNQTINLLSPLSIVETKLLGIENTKIILSKNGKKILLDPFGNGSYIWPSLSPDNESILAYEMDHGTFICDLNGKIISRLGRKDAPVWTRDGKWIIYMDDKDNGQNLISSDIYCISPDGKINILLSKADNIIKLNPGTSPVENKIVYNTLNGEIYLLSYEEISK